MKQTVTYGYEVKNGDICVYVGGDGRYIIKVSGKGQCDEYISPNGSFYKHGGGCIGTWVEATPEEKEWLKLCIQDGQIVPRERAMEVVKNLTPTINNSYEII